MKLILLATVCFFSFLSLQAQGDVRSNKHKFKKVYEGKIATYYAQNKDITFAMSLDSFLIHKIPQLLYLFEDTSAKKITIEILYTKTKANYFCDLNITRFKRRYSPLSYTDHKGNIKIIRPNSSPHVDSLYDKWGGFYKVVLHEYIHGLFYHYVGERKAKKIPKWLLESASIYLSGQLLFDQSFKMMMDLKIEQGELPQIAEFNSMKKFGDMYSFSHWSYLLFEFLMENYGWYSLLFNSPGYKGFDQYIGYSEERLNKQWFDYLYKKSSL